MTVVLLAATLTTSSSHGQQRDFDLSRSRMDLRELMPGGPGKDWIPALSGPPFVTADQARHVADGELVAGISLSGRKKAYPLQLLNNTGYPFDDTIAGAKIRVYPGFGNTAYITDSEGNLMPAIVAYWFAWSAFHKDTLLYAEIPDRYEGAVNDER